MFKASFLALSLTVVSGWMAWIVSSLALTALLTSTILWALVTSVKPCCNALSTFVFAACFSSSVDKGLLAISCFLALAWFCKSCFTAVLTPVSAVIWLILSIPSFFLVSTSIALSTSVTDCFALLRARSINWFAASFSSVVASWFWPTNAFWFVAAWSNAALASPLVCVAGSVLLMAVIPFC